MRISRRLTFLGAAVALIAGVSVVEAPPASASTQISYIVAAHPDDENTLWSLVTGSSGNYKVFVVLTHGESTAHCLTLDQGTTAGGGGPYSFEGPNNTAAGQPDYGEVNPLGSTGNPWQGKWKAACRDARRKSMFAFLNQQAINDASIPNGTWTCTTTADFSGLTPDPAGPATGGLDPTGLDTNGARVVSRKATVCNASNGTHGKVIFWDLGDGDLTEAEVLWAVQKTRANKSVLGIPTNLPDFNAVVPFVHNVDANGVPLYSGCEPYPNRDHLRVHNVAYSQDIAPGKQWGRTCSNDTDSQTVNGGRQNTIPTTQWNAQVAGSATHGPGRCRSATAGWSKAGGTTHIPTSGCARRRRAPSVRRSPSGAGTDAAAVGPRRPCDLDAGGTARSVKRGRGYCNPFARSDPL